MAGKKNEVAATGRAVAANVKRLREEQNLGYAELSRRLDEQADRDIPPLGLRRIESHERRVDADDLVALAVALSVSPLTLLMPDTPHAADIVTVTGIPGAPAEDMLAWLRAEVPLVHAGKPADQRKVRDGIEFMLSALPHWATEELTLRQVSGSDAHAYVAELLERARRELQRYKT